MLKGDLRLFPKAGAHLNDDLDFVKVAKITLSKDFYDMPKKIK